MDINYWSIKKENVYGHKKRLHFFINAIQLWKNHSKRKMKEVRILDVGCGTGTMITLPIASAGYHITAIDTSAESIRIAKNINIYNRATFLHGNTEMLHQTFDIIICSEVLEHLQDPSHLINEFKRLLDHDGRLLITVPNGYGLYELDDYLWRLLSFQRVYNWAFRTKRKILHQKQISSIQKDSTLDHSPHIQHFTFRKVKKQFTNSGFVIEKKEGSSIMAGKFTQLLFPYKWFTTFTTRLSNYVPIACSAGFYFIFRKKP